LKLVGLISDTHIPARARAVPKKIFEVFQGASLILHAGDLTQLSVVDELERLAPVVAVCGNMDGYEVREKLPIMNSVKVYKWKIGVIHNSGIFWGTKRMKTIAKRNNFDALIFGHTPSTKPQAGRGNHVRQPGKSNQSVASLPDKANRSPVESDRRKD